MSGPFSDIVIAARQREEKVIADLNAIEGGDPESSHSRADAAILLFIAEQYPDIYDAYEAVIGRENGSWWFA